MTKTTEELIQEFLDNGGEIEKIEPMEVDNKQTIGSTSKKAPELMTLSDGADMFGEKRKRKKTKKQEAPSINKDLIPEHLHHILNKSADDKQENGDDKGGATNETN